MPIMIACHDSYRPPISFRDKCVLEIAPFPGFDLSAKWTLEGKTVLGGVGGGGRTQRENPCSSAFCSGEPSLVCGSLTGPIPRGDD